MIWFTLALVTALASASQDSWVKYKFSSYSTAEMLAFPMLYSLPLLGVALFWVTIPQLDRTFWWCFLVSLPLNGVAFFLHMRAIQISPLSLTLPYLSFTPAFMFGTGFLFLGELPNLWGAVGVGIIVTGSYVLNINPSGYTLLAPFRSLFKERGSMIMLLVAVMYSLAAVLGKKAILHSSVLFFTLFFFLSLNSLTLLVMELSVKGRVARVLSRPGPGSIAGVLFFTHLICHGWAISLTKAVYMISIKRMSILFGVLYGGIFFAEENLWYRLTGTALMVAGATLISLKGL
ncbi:DMT family transporter [Desulfogranum mediterraneum]|uniref:DMT family transporter n=1 Tax=Desulfogranum mediterraneum TaxID=160661 RepID=UPI0004257306|nr:DMT family transporter [Desulfogranum mediterraneum]